jgi:CRP-like cAMP-binding protein
MSFFNYPAGQSGPGWGFLDSASERGYAQFKAHCEVKRFADGETIVKAGSLDRSLWVVLGGDLEVQVPGKGGVSRVGAGTVFGEVAFFDAAPRSADVIARGSVELLVLTFDAFERLAAAEPELARTLLMDLGRFLAQRLRAADAR